MKYIIIFIIGWHLNLQLVESIPTRRDYEYKSHKSVYIPFTIRYPPIFQVDSVWPFSSSSPNTYQYPTSKEQPNIYQYEGSFDCPPENEAQNEVLIKSLNLVLTKLYRFLPPSNNRRLPITRNPIILVEALNLAMDSLEQSLSREPLPLMTNQGMQTSVDSSSRSPDRFSISVNNAINELDKLFATLPDELKSPTELPRPLKPNSEENKNGNKLSSSVLFTSKVPMKQNENVNNRISTPSTPILSKIDTTSKASQEKLSNMLFTSAIDTPTSSEAPTTMRQTTLSPEEYPEIDIRFGQNKNDEIVFPDSYENKNPTQIDLINRFKEKDTTTSVSVQFNPTTQPNKPLDILSFKPSRPPIEPNPVFYPETTITTSTEKTDFPNRNKETTQKPNNFLEYKPSRPPFAPDPVFYPENAPTTIISGDLSDRNKMTSTTEPIKTTQATLPPGVTFHYSSPLDLEYKPSRPPFAPNPIVYPRPIIAPGGTPWPASSTEKN